MNDIIKKNKKGGGMVSMDKLIYESDFISEDEVNEVLDNIMQELGKEIEKEDNQDAIVVPIKVKMVMYAYKILKHLTMGTEAKVTYKLNKPYKSMGSVSVVGRNLSICDTKEFVAVAKLASNLDIYPKTNGAIQIDFTFHGLTQKL